MCGDRIVGELGYVRLAHCRGGGIGNFGLDAENQTKGRREERGRKNMSLLFFVRVTYFLFFPQFSYPISVLLWVQNFQQVHTNGNVCTNVSVLLLSPVVVSDHPPPLFSTTHSVNIMIIITASLSTIARHAIYSHYGRN